MEILYSNKIDEFIEFLRIIIFEIRFFFFFYFLVRKKFWFEIILFNKYIDVYDLN